MTETDGEKPPAVGTLKQYTQAPFERQMEWSSVNDVVRIEGEQADHHMVTHPEYVEEVLFGKNEKIVKLGGFEAAFGGGIVAEQGDQWRKQREVIQPAFRPSRIQSYCDSIRRVVTAIISEMDPNEPVDMWERSTDLTMEVMLETLFGGANDAEEGQISRAAERITEWFLEATTAGDVPNGVQSSFETSIAELRSLIDTMVTERDGDRDSSDLLSTLIAVGQAGEAEYTEERIRDEMITMFFAAHETTALTLTYALFLLAAAPAAESRVRDEVAGLTETVPTGEQLDELEYTEQVMKEAMRMYPPAHTLFREVVADIEIGDYTIPEGDVVYLSQWVIHRDERWWDDPNEFRPERFDDTVSHDRPRFAFFPFGAGPRRCVGRSFAYAEAKMALGGLVNQYTFERETESFGMLASITAVPDQPVELVPRIPE